MTELALDIRHRYLDVTLTRTAEWLTDPGLLREVGAEAVAATQGILARLYSPNIVHVGRRYITLQTPSEYQDADYMPMLVGFPGDRFVPDGHMLRQTSLQRERAVAQFTLMYGDEDKAKSIIKGYDDRKRSQATGTSMFFVTRYDTEAAVAQPNVRTLTFGPRDRPRALFTTPIWLLTMGDMDEGYKLVSPATMMHEAVHAKDHETAGSLPVYDLRKYRIATELRAHRLGAKVEAYARLHGMIRPDERADYNRFPDETSFAELFETIRAKHNTDADPYAVSEELDDELVAARLFPAKYATVRKPLVG